MLELGPELFALLNAKQSTGSRKPVVYGDGGLSVPDIKRIESELGFPLPDDFAFLLRNVRDSDSVFFSWADFRKKDYDDAIEWVLQGILEGIEYSVIEDGLWLTRWGRRPKVSSEVIEIVRRDFATWPKLLPLHAHRFLAAEPCRANNPVFSIMGMDIICYGANLAHYLMLEFVDRTPDAYARHVSDREIASIDVWSDLAT